MRRLLAVLALLTLPALAADAPAAKTFTLAEVMQFRALMEKQMDERLDEKDQVIRELARHLSICHDRTSA